MNRLKKQIDFILEIDKLKSIVRKSPLIDGSRFENSAEHSWHLAMMVLVLSEHANDTINPLRVLKMLLVHDIVEIDAGDTFIHDDNKAKDKQHREEQAANRIFKLLPRDQERELRILWLEYENRNTTDAKFAYALDRLMPLLHSFHSNGKIWQEYNIVKDQVIDKNEAIDDASTKLWEYAHNIIDQAVKNKYLAEF